MIVFINRFNKFINNDLQHITIPKYHNFIKKNISSSSSLPVTSFFSKKICQSFAEFKNCTTFASAIKQHGRLAQLVQSIWFTPRGSGVRIPQRPPPTKPEGEKERTKPCKYHAYRFFCHLIEDKQRPSKVNLSHFSVTKSLPH